MRSTLGRTCALLTVIAFNGSVQAADMNSELQTVRNRFLDELAAAKVDAPAIRKHLAAQRPDGSFSDLDYANKQVNDAWQPKMHLDRVVAFAAAWLSKDPAWAKNAELKAAARAGIDYWLAKDFKNSNWFWNEIGVPGLLMRSMLAFYEDLSPAQKKKAIEIISRAKLGSEGTNLVWLSQIVAQRGLIQKDPALVKAAFAKIAAEVHAVTKQSDGAQPDNSFLYHGPLLYTWGYGCYYLRDNTRLAGLVAGTSFAYPAEKIALIRDWTLDGFQWQARGRGADFGGEGREVGRKGQNAAILDDIGTDLLNLKAGRADDVSAMLARTRGEASAKPLVGNKQFWRADMMVHHRVDYYASARFYSARTKNTEWGNGEALQSFYLADGANVLMRTGQEYLDIFPVWDWQRIPGTTVELLQKFGPIQGKPDDAPDGFNPGRNKITNATKQAFVGGVSDGQYGVSGGKFDRGTLALHKTYFFFDDQYVCLGAGLKCDTDNTVITTLDQRYADGESTAAGDEAARTVRNGEQTIASAQWLLNDGVGYVFLSPTNLHVKTGPQTGSWRAVSVAYDKTPVTADVFKAWIDHGARPTGASYAYAVYPKADAAKLRQAVARSDVTIVSNTAALQAVWHSDLRRGGAFAYDAGDITFRSGLNVTVSRPCALMIAETANGVAVTVANPENKEAVVKVVVTRDGKTVKADVVLPGGEMAGRSVTKTIAF